MIIWTEDRMSDSSAHPTVRCLLASFDEQPTLFRYRILVSERGPDEINLWRTPKDIALTRWCVFNDGSLKGYCGDIPLDLPIEEVKAMAVTLWRLGGYEV